MTSFASELTTGLGITRSWIALISSTVVHSTQVSKNRDRLLQCVARLGDQHFPCHIVE